MTEFLQTVVAFLLILLAFIILVGVMIWAAVRLLKWLVSLAGQLESRTHSRRNHKHENKNKKEDDTQEDGSRGEQLNGDTEDEDARIVAWFIEQFESMEEQTPRTSSEQLGHLAALFDDRDAAWVAGNRSWVFRGLIIEESAAEKIRPLGLGDRLEAMIEARRQFLKKEAPEKPWILRRELGEPYEEPPHPHWVAVLEALGEEGVQTIWNEVDRLTRETAIELLERGSPIDFIDQDAPEEIREEHNHFLDRLREQFYPQLDGPVRDYLDDQIRYRFAEQHIDPDDFDLPKGGNWFLELDPEVVSPLPGDDPDVIAPSLRLELSGFGLYQGSGVFLSPSSRVVTWSTGFDEFRRGVTAADATAAKRLLEWAKSKGPGVEGLVAGAGSMGVLLTEAPGSDGRMTPIHGFAIREPPAEVMEMLLDLASRPFG